MESASDEIKAKISEFEQMDATEAEKEMMKMGNADTGFKMCELPGIKEQYGICRNFNR